MRDSFGQMLMAMADEIAAVDDRTLRLRMKRRFPVSRALANSAMIMPERLALTDASRQVSEVVGSFPFRFLPDGRVSGTGVTQRFWQNVPYIPLGQRFQPYAFNTRVRDVPRGFPLFYGVKLS